MLRGTRIGRVSYDDISAEKWETKKVCKMRDDLFLLVCFACIESDLASVVCLDVRWDGLYECAACVVVTNIKN